MANLDKKIANNFPSPMGKENPPDWGLLPGPGKKSVDKFQDLTVDKKASHGNALKTY